MRRQFPGLRACPVLHLALPEDAAPSHTHTEGECVCWGLWGWGWGAAGKNWVCHGRNRQRGSEEAPVLPRLPLLHLSDPSHIRWLPGLRQSVLPEASLSLGSFWLLPFLLAATLIDLERLVAS